jgi:MFS family permease
MVESFGVPIEKVAIWAGLVTACFSFCQFLSGIPWGRWSDKNGRKPAILVGVTMTAITSIGFGMSKSLWVAIAFRCVSGLGNGVVGISRTTVAEMVPHKDLQPRAFATIPLMWNIGSVLGPLLGGFLANPARQYPKIFGNIQFFKTFPYALPNFAGSIVFIIGITTGFLFLKVCAQQLSRLTVIGNSRYS